MSFSNLPIVRNLFFLLTVAVTTAYSLYLLLMYGRYILTRNCEPHFFRLCVYYFIFCKINWLLWCSFSIIDNFYCITDISSFEIESRNLLTALYKEKLINHDTVNKLFVLTGLMEKNRVQITQSGQ